MEIEIHEHHFQLLHQKAIFWKETKTLLISDLHLGKIMHFRKAGIALPSNAPQNNIQRLDELMGSHDVHRILFLGDLFHNRHNEEWEHFAEWRNKYTAIEAKVIRGNHDILPKHLFDECQIEIHDEWTEGCFLFTHHPVKISGSVLFAFSGHIHPVYCLRSPARQSMRLPCFVFDEQQAILPSFGVFTGGFEMHRIPGRRVFVIADKKIMTV